MGSNIASAPVTTPPVAPSSASAPKSPQMPASQYTTAGPPARQFTRTGNALFRPEYLQPGKKPSRQEQIEAKMRELDNLFQGIHSRLLKRDEWLTLKLSVTVKVGANGSVTTVYTNRKTPAEREFRGGLRRLAPIDDKTDLSNRLADMIANQLILKATFPATGKPWSFTYNFQEFTP